MKCRSIRYAPGGGVEIIDAADVAPPGDHEVQLQALACGICAWDLHVYRNGSDWSVCPGHEGIARVIAVGPGATRFREGDWVTGCGLGVTELCNMSEYSLYKVPSIGAPEHWIIEPVSCIVTGLDHSALRAGDRLAVVGCGFMGLMFVQALSKSLVDRLVAIDIDPARLEMARTFGATDVIDARSADVGSLQSLSLDTVIDCSGSQNGLNLSSQIVRKGGRLNLFGWNHGTGQFPGDLWHMNGITVVNSAPNSAVRDPWPVAIRMLERGQIDLKPLVSHVVPLEEYPSLLALACQKNSGYLKGVVKLADASAPLPTLHTPPSAVAA
jgi:threonine dehydrogenase-like Zn-dependent dehydrogenase